MIDHDLLHRFDFPILPPFLSTHFPSYPTKQNPFKSPFLINSNIHHSVGNRCIIFFMVHSMNEHTRAHADTACVRARKFIGLHFVGR